MPSKAKKLDTLTNWSGTYEALFYQIVSRTTDSEPKIEEFPITFTIKKVGEAGYEVTYTYLQNTDVAIGLSFEYCNNTKELLLVDVHDDTEMVFIASLVQGKTVVRFQNTLSEFSTGPNSPAFVGFSVANRL